MMNHGFVLEKELNQMSASPLFKKIFGLVPAGMILDASDVYMAGATNTSMLNTHFITLAQSPYFLSAGFMGLFIGSIIAGYIGDKYGRKVTYQLNLLIFGLTTLLGAFAPNFMSLIILRFIAACVLGSEIVTGYAIINEFSPSKTRGRWAGATAIVANLGAPLALFLSFIIIPKFSWRGMFIIIGIAGLLLWMLRRNFPESLRWLIYKQRYKEAQIIIDKMNDDNNHTNINDVKNSQIKMMPKISYHKALFIVTIMISAILVSQYLFTSWIPTLLMQRGLNIAHSLGYTLLMITGAPVGALIVTLLIDMVGRRKTIIASFMIAAILALIYPMAKSGMLMIMVGFFLTTSFYILMASVLGVYSSELFSTSHRFRGTGIANGIAKLLTVLTPFFAKYAISAMNPNLIFILIAILMMAAALLVMLIGPETKQKMMR